MFIFSDNFLLSFCATKMVKLGLSGECNFRMIEQFALICHSQSLKFLDVSKNSLQSAKLGSQSQLPNLVNLSLAFNPIKSLKKDDFILLSNSTSLQVLNLTSVSLKTVRNFSPLETGSKMPN